MHAISWLFVGLVPVVYGQGDIAALLSSQPDLSTLSSTIQSISGLAETLSTSSNITIFAPTDEAFKKQLAVDSPVTTAINNKDTDAIKALLLRHVQNGLYPSSDISAPATFVQSLLTPTPGFANTTGGEYTSVVKNGIEVQVGSGDFTVSKVTEADIKLGDGIIIHKVDTVLSFNPNVTTSAANNQLTYIADALATAGLTDAVDTTADLTIFVPSNEAFESIGSVVNSVNASTLASVLQYHVVPGTVAFSTSLSNTTIPTLAGGDLTISVTDAGIFVNQALVTLPNILLSNGVAHVIDSVLDPLAPFDASTLDPSAPAASRVAFPDATAASSLSFASLAPTASTVNMVPVAATPGAVSTPSAGRAGNLSTTTTGVPGNAGGASATGRPSNVGGRPAPTTTGPTQQTTGAAVAMATAALNAPVALALGLAALAL